MADEPRPPESPQELRPVDRSAGGKQPSDDLSSWHRLSGVGIEFIVAFGLFAWLGWWLDKKFATAPWLLIAGCVIGFTVGLWSLIRAAQKMMK